MLWRGVKWLVRAADDQASKLAAPIFWRLAWQA